MSLASCACVCAIVGAGVFAAKNLNTKPDIIDTPNKAVSVTEKKNTFPFDLRDYEVNCICKINDGSKTEFSLTDEQKNFGKNQADGMLTEKNLCDLKIDMTELCVLVQPTKKL